METAMLTPEAAVVVSVLMKMWADLGTPEEVLEMILSYDGSDLDIEIIETPHGTIRFLKQPNIGASIG